MMETFTLQLLLFSLAGGATGWLYFALLRRSLVSRDGKPATSGFILLLMLRLAIAGAGFWAIAQEGAVPLMAALAGFLVVRFAMQRRMVEG
jgi:hypothetical protein